MPMNLPRLTLVERVRAYADALGLWQPGAHVLVAVSGGPDSVALLDMLATVLAPAAGLHLAVAHVHHGLRAAATADAAFVEALAARYALPCYLAQVDVPARVVETGESVEEAARILRYAALARLADEAGADHIATAHTADDQAETVLMRLLRGTGVAGLAGIPPRRDRIIRPLLEIWRREIEDYLRLRELTACIDESNYATDFTRNRIRLELLPMLEAQYAPRLRTRLAHLAEMARQDNAALEAVAEEAYARYRTPWPGGVALPLAPPLPQAIIWRLWRRALAEVRGTLEEIGYEHLAAIAGLTPRREVHLPGARVLHEAGRLVFLPAAPGPTPPVTIPARPLPVPGRTCLLAAGCCLTTERYSGPLDIRGGDIAVLRADAVREPLCVRSWRPGDRFRPLGTGGTRKVQDIFVDAGVPKRLRDRVPLVLDGDGIIWLAGFRIADRVKMERGTTSSLRISIEWELNPWTVHSSEPA